MTTEQLAIVVTGAVGALGIISPAFVSWVQRKHERELARSARLHAQRLDVYRKLGHFLETERIRLVRIEPLMVVGAEPPELPPDLTDEEWAHLQGDAAVAGSDNVRKALEDYHKARQGFIAHAYTLRSTRAQQGQSEQAAESAKAMIDARKTALEKIGEAERVMRAELERL